MHGNHYVSNVPVQLIANGENKVDHKGGGGREGRGGAHST